jgi:lipopolysaccharide transport system ATP-binding protein
MRRAEIERQFDAIVSFAEVERFIDTPVKHYSSGMYLRLAFSVAAHLEPEILLVDEVLAVGDLAFQKKCLGKMEDVAAQGRTVLFVSHNLGAIKEMCQTCVVLGPAAQALMLYSQSLVSISDEINLNGRSGWGHITINNLTEGFLAPVDNDTEIIVEASLNISNDLDKMRLCCLIDDSNGHGVMHNFIDFNRAEFARFNAGTYKVNIEIPPLWLMPDAYTLYFKLIGRTTSGADERCISERMILDLTDRTGRSAGKIRAVLIPPVEWSLRETGVTNEEIILAKV